MLRFFTAAVCLLQRVNEKPQVVTDYEAGRAIPNQQIINKLERVVGKCVRGSMHYS